jgi:2,3-bisphosphoglycerate-dependent phosphoglycerate mutase
LLGIACFHVFTAIAVNQRKIFMHHHPCLILIRHAQSENNAFPDHLRVSDPNITELGVVQAKKLAMAVHALEPTVLYCSAFLRSLETTRPIAEVTGLRPMVRQDIYEQGGCHRGYLPNPRIAERGMGREILSKRYANWHLDDRIEETGWFDLDHYESREEANHRAQRVKAWLESESRTHNPSDRVAMVIHADFKLRLIEALLDDLDIESKLGEVVNTSITRLSKVSGRWRLDYWNVFSHLTANEISA